MTARRIPPWSAVLATALLLTACGGGSSSTVAGSGVLTSDDLDRRAYLSTEVEGHDLVPGTRIRLEFQEGRLAANTGCNSMGGPYAVTGGRLSWTEGPAMTEMGCAPERMDQDQWLVELLTSGVDATLVGETLVLTEGDVTVRLQPEVPAEAATLFGRTWTVTDLTTPNTASAIPNGVRTPTFDVGRDGSVSLDTGCNRGRTHATANGDVLTFAPVALTKMACPPPATEVEQAVLQALEGRVTVTVDGDTAVLDNGRHGLMVALGPHA